MNQSRRQPDNSLAENDPENIGLLGQKSGEIGDVAPGHQNPENGALTVVTTDSDTKGA